MKSCSVGQNGVHMEYSVRWTQVWYLTNGSCGEPLDASLHTQPMSSVQAESPSQTDPSFSVKSLALYFWAFQAFGHLAGGQAMLGRGSNVAPTCGSHDHMYSPYRTEHTYPGLGLISRDIFGWPSSMVNNSKQAIAGERVAELEIGKTGVDFGLM